MISGKGDWGLYKVVHLSNVRMSYNGIIITITKIHVYRYMTPVRLVNSH